MSPVWPFTALVATVVASPWLLSPAFAARRGIVECTVADETEPGKFPIGKIRTRAKRLPRAFKRRKIHILDLGDEALDRRGRLPDEIADQQWCSVLGHVTYLEDALSALTIDEPFLTDKLHRTESWLRAGRGTAQTRDKAERAAAEASAAIQDGNLRRANEQLNQAIRALFGLSGNWEIPAGPIETNEDRDEITVEIDAIDVEAGCPDITRRRRPRQAELHRTLEALRKEMNVRAVRATDFKTGAAMVEALSNYRRLDAVWPAMRITCALLNRVRTVKIDSGIVQGRFGRVRLLRPDAKLTEEGEARFKHLVREASDALANTEYARAHRSLDELLVLLGDPERPSDAIR